MGALAGGSGAAQAGIGGGGRGGRSGGIPSGATDVGGRIAEGVNGGGGEVHIHWDPVDPNNSRHQRIDHGPDGARSRGRGYKIIEHRGGR